MNAFSQFLVEITWSLTMGILVVVGILAAQALGVALGVAVGGALLWKGWKAWTHRRHRGAARNGRARNGAAGED
ncbi:MAG TPA: hypothetical protein VM055_00545 [Novosphingobium sp.]|nr:hypothetical protein [Novosphingobium sp.]